MRNVRITEFPEGTKTVNDVGKSQGYLPVTVQYGIDKAYGAYTVDTWWAPEPHELAMLNAGGVIVLHQLAHALPPMTLTVRPGDDAQA